MSICPYCSEEGMKDWGDLESNILLIGSAPSEEELHYHKMFYGAVGQIFRREINKFAGIELSDCHVTSLFIHDKPKKKGDIRCIELGQELCLQKIATKQYVVLIGADAVRWATGLSIDDVNGFDVTSDLILSSYFYGEAIKFRALVNPSSTYSGGLGELRFGLTQMKGWLENG
jgi:hypothetical protein